MFCELSTFSATCLDRSENNIVQQQPHEDHLVYAVLRPHQRRKRKAALFHIFTTHDVSTSEVVLFLADHVRLKAVLFFSDLTRLSYSYNVYVTYLFLYVIVCPCSKPLPPLGHI